MQLPGMCGGDALRNLKREPGLADPARTGQREEANTWLRQEGNGCRNLIPTADKAREGNGQVGWAVRE